VKPLPFVHDPGEERDAVHRWEDEGGNIE